MKLQFKLCPKEFNKRLGQSTRIAISDDASLIAFSDKDNSLQLYHKVNHRIITLFEGDHPVSQLLFTRDYLFASEEGTNEVLVFSLKNFKLKKKLTSHRNRITKLDYNSNRHLVLSQSGESCILWNSITLAKEKTLNCSTSFFQDSTFTYNGQYLINLFDDSNVFYWCLDTFEQTETFVRETKGRCVMAASRNQYVAVADSEHINMANFVYDQINFHPVEAPHLSGGIQGILFFDTLMLVRTTTGLYAGPITESYKIHTQLENVMPGAKEFAVSYSNDFVAVVSASNDILIGTLSQQYFIESGHGISDQKVKNPLDNSGCYCAGGFCNKKGCQNIRQLPKPNKYQEHEHMLEKIYKSALISIDDLRDFSKEKLSEFLRRNHRFVDKHRAITYKYLLELQSNLVGFKTLLRQGVHESTKMLPARYPIKNVILLEKMKTIVSLLAQYCPVFGEADNIPCLVFPLVSVLGEDELLCFEVLHRLLTYWLQFLFETFPVANADVVQNIEEILEEIEPAIVTHFQNSGLNITKLIWELLSSLFSDVLDRQNYLSLVDTLFCYRTEPQLVFFMVISFIIHTKPTILNLQNNAQFDHFLNSENNLNIGKFLNTMHKLHAQHKDKIRYRFKLIVPWDCKDYGVYSRYPREAVQIYRSKRQLQHKDYEFELERQRYTHIIHEKMNVVATNERRRIQREAKLSEAHLLRFQNEQKNQLPIVKPDDHKRIDQMKNIITLMQENISTQEKVVQTLKDIPISLPVKDTRIDSEMIDSIENKLIKMMISQPPQPIISHLVHPLVFTENSKQPELMKSKMNMELMESMRNITELERLNQQKKWEGELAKVYDHTR